MQSRKGLFVSGVQQRTGKTLVAAALAMMLHHRQVNVGVMKPVETGVSELERLGCDGRLLCWAAGSSQATDRVSPYRLREKLTPADAATEQKIRIDYNSLVEQAKAVIEEHEFTLVEGTGGLMTPLAGGLMMGDFIKALGLPVLFICRPGPDAVDLTLLTLFAAHALQLPVAGYLINDMPQIKKSGEEKLAHTLAMRTRDELFGVLDNVEGTDEEKVAKLEKQITGMRTLSLLSPYLP